MLPGFPLHAGHQAVNRGIRLNFGAIEIELLAPDQPRRDAQFHDPFKELLKGRQAIALADLAESAVVGHCFSQGVADVPALRQVQVVGAIVAVKSHFTADGGDALPRLPALDRLPVVASLGVEEAKVLGGLRDLGSSNDALALRKMDQGIKRNILRQSPTVGSPRLAG